MTTDFQTILASSVETFDEGLRFFMGEGILNQELWRLIADLERHGIAYAVIGAIALNQHGYQRFTSDIDLLLTKDGLQRFHDELVGLGYRPAFPGARKSFRTTTHNVTVEVITAGEYPGDGLPKAVVFADPQEVSIPINGIQTLTLAKLIELKIAAGRLKDLADVVELIKLKNLTPEFASQLEASVQGKFTELYEAARREQEGQKERDLTP